MSLDTMVASGTRQRGAGRGRRRDATVTPGGPARWTRAAILGLVAALLLHAAPVGGAWAAGTPTGETDAAGTPTPAATPVTATPAAATRLVVGDDPISTLVPASPDSPAIYAIGGKAFYRSSDGGETWRTVGPLPPPGRIIAAEDDPLLLLAGSHPPCARGGGGEPPLYRSADGGATWQVVEEAAGILPLAIWSRADLALGASCAGLRLSTNAGRRWRTTPVMGADYEITAFAALPDSRPTEPRGLGVGTSEGGTSRLWLLDLADPARASVGPPLTSFWGTGALAGREQTFVVGTATGVLVSTDGGASWRQSRQGLEDVTLSVDPTRGPIPEDELRRGFGIGAVVIDPGDPDRVYAGTVDGLYASTDRGATWRQLPGLSGLVTGLVLAPAGGRLFAQLQDGVVVVPLRP